MKNGRVVGAAPDLLNPFVHHLELTTPYDKVKTAILTLILLPIRVVIICFLLIAGWLIACVGLYGLNEEDLQRKPIVGWRRKLIPILCFVGKSTYTAGGMHISIKGKQAARDEAPILVIAPHSTFLDGGLIYFTGLPSTIVRRESGANPYIQKLINFTQPVYVWRDDPDSRHNTIKEIINRATSKEDWPQILIFPEGTCTNRTCLITFKPGAFYPGVPIQPVCIRYPNKFDTVTWTWEGPSAMKLLWLTLCQVSSYCELEFLPVYTPNEAEKRDPKLFAENVRNVMAKALGLPVVDYTYDDCKLMTRAKEMNLPCASALVEVQKMRQKLGLIHTNPEQLLLERINCQTYTRINFPQFCQLLNVPAMDGVARQLFTVFDRTSSGVIDFREYLLGVVASCTSLSVMDAVGIAFKVYDESGAGHLNLYQFSKALFHTLSMSTEEAAEIFHDLDKTNVGYVTYDKFRAHAETKSDYAHLFTFKEERSHHTKSAILCPDDVLPKKYD